jgi:hypothetical protein
LPSTQDCQDPRHPDNPTTLLLRVDQVIERSLATWPVWVDTVEKVLVIFGEQ